MTQSFYAFEASGSKRPMATDSYEVATKIDCGGRFLPPQSRLQKSTIVNFSQSPTALARAEAAVVPLVSNVTSLEFAIDRSTK